MGRHDFIRYYKFRNSRPSLVKQEMTDLRQKTDGLLHRGLADERDIKRYRNYVRKLVDERKFEILSSKRMSDFEKSERLIGLRYVNSYNEKTFKTAMKNRKKYKDHSYWWY